ERQRPRFGRNITRETQRILDLLAPFHRIEDAEEFHQEAVAGGFYDGTAAALRGRLQDSLHCRHPTPHGASLVGAHEQPVAYDVDEGDGRQSPPSRRDALSRGRLRTFHAAALCR